MTRLSCSAPIFESQDINPRVEIPELCLRTQNLLSRRQLLSMGITIRQGNIGDIVSPPFVSALSDVLCVAQVVI